MQVWRTIEGFPEHAVSNFGRVRKGCRMLQRWVKDGYLKVTLRERGRKVNRFVHVLVVEAFRGPRPPGYEALHADGVRRHCWLPNLRWGTRLDNQEDKRRHGTFLEGERAPRRKLSPRRVRALRRSSNPRRLAKRWGLTPRAAENARNGATWGDVG